MMYKRFYQATPILYALALSGCGGSDSSSPSNAVSVAKTSYQVESGAFEQSYVDIPFSVKYNAGDNLYYGIMSDTGNLISRVEYHINDNATGNVSIFFKDGYEIGNGTKSTTAQFAICYDEYCNQHYSGSPIAITLTNNVTLDHKMDLAAPKIETNADLTDLNVSQNVTDAINLSGSNLHNLYLEASANNRFVTSVTPFISHSNVALSMTLETPAVVGVGSFSSTIDVNVCYDSNCNYPIDGSPLAIPVNYIISNTLPNPNPGDGSPTTPNISAIDFDNAPLHNTVDATYSDALNVIAVVSDSPKNAIYFYSLNDTKAYEIELYRSPSAITVDNKNGTNRFVVGHDAMITTLAYNASSPQDTQVTNIYNSHDIFDLTTDGNHVWTLPKTDQWVDLQVIDLATGSVVSRSDWRYYEKTLLKISPNSQAFYSLDTNISPEDVAKTDISDPGNPADPIDSPYHGDYSFCDNFWFNHAGTFIYTQCGVRLNASSNVGLDMTYAGKITLPEQSSTIKTLDESHDSTKIAYALEGESNQVMVLTSNHLNLSETITLPDITINSSTYTTVPEFIFYGADGKLNIVANTTTNGTTRTLILRH
ncbi:hypothetical protein MID13_06530 [Vibrio gigantis]|uniref:hypothetical protein n=1 Tax=Vibrio gigantis TaxID=296199 RepID=UPI001EFA8EFB|nr:hypothetical protein [Vibrio gigantis]ULN65452.1 hypothetical protein MID13_06530 [Vibrio gigantis]